MSRSASYDQDARPLFSVLVATYNQADYVLDTLETVAQQTCADYEVVVVNDGSTDDTLLRLTSWSQQFEVDHANRVLLHTTKNQGQGAAFEEGFALCTGRYICLLDSDDLWLPEKLAKVSKLIAADPSAGMILHPLFVIDEEGRRTGDVRPQRARLSEGDLRLEVRRTSRHVAPATTGVVIRADVFKELLPTPVRGFKTHADLYLTLGACLLAPVRALEEPLGEYRMHPNGQHVRTMLSVDGLERYVELQTMIIDHFDLGRAAERNSYFVRHGFALSKLRGRRQEQYVKYRQLVRATWQDPSFGPRERTLFIAFWTACWVAPRPVFRRLWRAFTLKQTGFNRIGLGSTSRSAI